MDYRMLRESANNGCLSYKKFMAKWMKRGIWEADKAIRSKSIFFKKFKGLSSKN